MSLREWFAQEIMKWQQAINNALKKQDFLQVQFYQDCLILTQRACSLYLANYPLQQIYHCLISEFPQLINQPQLFTPYQQEKHEIC